MNQENNNFNQTNLNNNIGSTIPTSYNNNQVNQQSVNNQFQQPLNQQPINTQFQPQYNQPAPNLEKPKKSKLGLIIGIVVAVAVIITGIMVLPKLLKKVDNTQDDFVYLNDGVNSELTGTYAFVTNHNNDDTYTIYALKDNNEMIEIVTTEYSNWKNNVTSLFYKDGKIWFNDGEDIINSIDLNKGNNNYKITRYKFLEGYISDNDWFYVDNNKIYYFNTGALRICDLSTEVCEAMFLDKKQSFDLEIENEDVDISMENVYIDNNMNIYLTTKNNNYYRININDTYKDEYDMVWLNYTNILEIIPDSHSLVKKKVLDNSKYVLKTEYNDSGEIWQVSVNNKINEELDGLIPVTILPNNILMVSDSSYISFNNVKFYDLQKNKFIDNLFDYYSIYNEIWFVENN